MLTEQDIEDIFTYHGPFGDQTQRYVALRNDAKKLAYTIQAHCPESREKSLAITSLQQTIQWANAAIAIHEKEAKT